MKKILILVGDYVEDSQIAFPYNTLLSLGYTVDIATPYRKENETIKSAIFNHDDTFLSTYFQISEGHPYKITKNIETVDYKNYDALYLPGGHSPLHLHINPKVIEITKYFLENNKIVCSICYAVLILAATNHIKGKKLTGLPFTKVVAHLAGATYEEGKMCVVDGNLVTGFGNPALVDMMKEFLAKLK